MDGHDFIAPAGKLAAAPAASEATYRTVVSRTYYGAFHVARAFLVELGFKPVGNANVHAFVRHYLNASGHGGAIRAADQLRDLQSVRNRADYDLDDPDVGSQAVAMASVEVAHRVVSALENCRADEVRRTIREAIVEYERRICPR
jgi:uncharacterized protein (UPF0332 family)